MNAKPLVLDFSQPMRPKERDRVKITSAPEGMPSGTLAFPNRPELYELLPEREESGRE